MSHATHTVGFAGFVNRKGFTLLELSIVLTVVALIIGGVFIGKNLMRQAQVQAVVGEVAKYTQAVIDFRDKYQSLPGDMSNAESFWGSDVSCPNTPYTATPHTATCNGDGNGQIGNNVDSSASTVTEWFRAWQQLSDAGMVDGAYTGVSGLGGSYVAVIGSNVPASRMRGGGYSLEYAYVPNGDAYSPPVVGHVLEFGSPAPNSMTFNPILTPTEALSVDTKVDDGMPLTGNVIAFRPGESAMAANCVPSSSPSTPYNTGYTGVACHLTFNTGF